MRTGGEAAKWWRVSKRVVNQRWCKLSVSLFRVLVNWKLFLDILALKKSAAKNNCHMISALRSDCSLNYM